MHDAYMHTYRQTETETETEPETETETEKRRQRQRQRQTDGQTCMHTYQCKSHTICKKNNYKIIKIVRAQLRSCEKQNQ